jgi:hypothetical protein
MVSTVRAAQAVGVDDAILPDAVVLSESAPRCLRNFSNKGGEGRLETRRP